MYTLPSILQVFKIRWISWSPVACTWYWPLFPTFLCQGRGNPTILERHFPSVQATDLSEILFVTPNCRGNFCIPHQQNTCRCTIQKSDNTREESVGPSLILLSHHALPAGKSTLNLLIDWLLKHQQRKHRCFFYNPLTDKEMTPLVLFKQRESSQTNKHTHTSPLFSLPVV